MSLILLKRLSA